MFDRKQFDCEKEKNIKCLYLSEEVNAQALKFIEKSDKYNYAYNWTWMGLPIIQMPEDIILMQEIIWDTKPDVIIETGIAWGGSVVLYASILELLGKGKVIAVDKVLPPHNIEAIKKYNFANRLELIEGSSIDSSVVQKIKNQINTLDKVMVILDSNHTDIHVHDELKIYAPLVSKDSYLVVSDTIIEEIPEQSHRPRPWGHGNNPKTALDKFLQNNGDRFTRENSYNYKAINSFTRNGYIQCVK